jgi:hypothetical protein
MRPVGADALNLARLEEAEQDHLHRALISPTSSRKTVPLGAISSRPGLSR